jgi:hypothetical protein
MSFSLCHIHMEEDEENDGYETLVKYYLSMLNTVCFFFRYTNNSNFLDKLLVLLYYMHINR